MQHQGRTRPIVSLLPPRTIEPAVFMITILRSQFLMAVLLSNLTLLLANAEASEAGELPKIVRIDTELPHRYHPYTAPDSADVSNGKLGDLLRRHRESCTNDSPDAFYALFN